VNQNSLTIDPEKVEWLALYNLENRRPYASFFDWKNPNNCELGKQVKERSIFCELIKCLEKDAGCELFSTVRYGENPPDAVATDVSGHLVGIEVNELVDEKTVKLWSQGERKDKEWKTEEVIQEIKRILRKKSNKLSRSLYRKNILVMHTDERDLRWKFQTGKLSLSLHFFQKHPHIDEAYLLFSYQPGRETYPYLKLKFLQ
jgi:hypothetical protein